MFLAWSLILAGVNYARQRRLQYILLEFFHATVDNSLTLVCRRKNGYLLQPLNKKRDQSSKCFLYKTHSAPSIDHRDPVWSWYNNEDVLYRNENEEVVIKYGKIILENSEWKFHSSLTAYNQLKLIFFIIKVSEHDFINAKWSGHRQFLDDSARSIAQHQKNSSLFLYESSFNNFQSIVFNWSERALFKDLAAVEELYTCDSKSLLTNEALSPSVPTSKSINSIESQTFPSSIQFKTCDLQSAFKPDVSSSMSLSRCSFQSHVSCDSDVSDTSLSISIKNDANQQPYSLLEALYFKDLFGDYSSDDDAVLRNKRNLLQGEQSDSRAINKSDTCLSHYNNSTPSFSSRSKGTKECKNLASKSRRYMLGGQSRSMSPFAKSVFTTKPAVMSGMEWESRSYSSSVLPNYFFKLRQESCCTDNQLLEQTGSRKNAIESVEVSPSTTLNDLSDCLLLDSKSSRHEEEISHDYTCAKNKLSKKSQPASQEDGKEGKRHAEFHYVIAQPMMTTPLQSARSLASANQLMDKQKSPLKTVHDKAHHISPAEEVAMDSLGMSITQINRDRPSCSFAVNIKSALPLLNKKKLEAKRLPSLEQQLELDYYFYAPNHNMLSSVIDTDSAADNRQKNRQLSVSSASGRSVSPLTLSLLANYGSREVLDPLMANKAQPDSFLFGRRASSRNLRNHRRFHSTETRRSTVCLTDPGYKSILKSGLSSPKVPEKMHSAFETTNRPSKPPYVLVYTGDENELFTRISICLKGILPLDTFTVNHLSTNCLINYPWFDENCICLLISNTKYLDDQAWSRLQAYFVNSGKILFVCQNKLLANLTNCRTLKKQASLLRNAFGKNSTSNVLGKDLQKDFEAFMKKSLKKMEAEKEVNEAFHAKDVVGGYGFSVVFFKKTGQPLLLYMQNGEQKTQSSAVFADATTEQLLSSSLLADALSRLGVDVIERDNASNSPLKVTGGYLMCQKDRLLLDLKGLRYGKLIGNNPKLVFLHPETRKSKEEMLLSADSKTITVETRLRKMNIQDFESNRYFYRLNTKSLGRVLVYFPVCKTTFDISKSISNAFPTYDGVLVVGGYQTKGQGRGSNEYLSPVGCASYTFNFVIPVNSCLGRSISFVQHIMTVAIVDAVSNLVDDETFPLQIKWPNDLYFDRKHKIGGVLVDALLKANQYECFITGSINVANTKPTVCLNDMLPSDCDKTLTVEEVLAEIMNKFEYYVNMFVHKGKETFISLYYKLWMHNREEVSIIHKHNNCKEKVIIRGLDDHGFLEVRSKQTGQIFSVHNDGNSFDMMRGLIHPNE